MKGKIPMGRCHFGGCPVQ